MQLTDCGYNVHKQCKDEAGLDCQPSHQLIKRGKPHEIHIIQRYRNFNLMYCSILVCGALLLVLLVNILSQSVPVAMVSVTRAQGAAI